jgi:transposase
MTIPRALEAEIVRLHHAEKWPIGTIATQLRVHHETVRRVLAQAGVPVPVRASRPSLIEPYRAFLVDTLTKYPTIRATRLHAMARERGYPGAVDHFRTLITPLRPRPAAEAYLRLRTLPGEQGQVDWAHFHTLTIGRATRPLMAFVMVLSTRATCSCASTWVLPWTIFCVATSPPSRTSKALRGRCSTTI